MILVPFFAISTVYGSTKNLLSLPFQAPVFFAQRYSFGRITYNANISKKQTCGVDFMSCDFWVFDVMITLQCRDDLLSCCKQANLLSNPSVCSKFSMQGC